MKKEISTYSMWKSFRDCRKAYELKYERHLKPLATPQALYFGSLIHKLLEAWHSTRSDSIVFKMIDAECPNRGHNIQEKATWHLCREMMIGYMRTYRVEEFEVVELENSFSGEITNPKTGAQSRTFSLSGKVDGLVKMGSEYFILEHKTASQIDGGYLERLWTDAQIILYASYIEELKKIKISGIIYNILGKTRLRQSAGETEGEYEARLKELMARSKTGKSSAKRKMPESDDAFQNRLRSKYNEAGMFHRELIYISNDQFEWLKSEIWELTKSLQGARRRGAFYRNTSQCFNYGRPCQYWPICLSGESKIIIDNDYEIVLPHEELRSNSGNGLEF